MGNRRYILTTRDCLYEGFSRGVAFTLLGQVEMKNLGRQIPRIVNRVSVRRAEFSCQPGRDRLRFDYRSLSLARYS